MRKVVLWVEMKVEMKAVLLVERKVVLWVEMKVEMKADLLVEYSEYFDSLSEYLMEQC